MTDIKNFGLVGIGADVQIGKGGVRIFSNGTTLTVTSPLIASSPSNGNHVTTREFVETNTMGRKTITLNEGTPTTFGVISGTIVRFTISIDNAFSNPFTIGTNDTNFVTQTDFDYSSEGVYEIVAVLPVDEEILVDQNGNGTGVATLILEYWPES